MMKSSIFLVGILVDLCQNPRIPPTTLFDGITLTFGSFWYYVNMLGFRAGNMVNHGSLLEILAT